MKHINRSNDIYKEFFNFKVVHGGEGLNYVRKFKNYKPPVIDSDIKVVMISDLQENYFVQMYMQADTLNFSLIKLDKFRCFIDKVEPLLEFIKTVKEPFILTLDASDTVITSDITTPQNMLDSYNCKILFNADDGQVFPGHPSLDQSYRTKHPNYYGKVLDNVFEINRVRLQNKTKIIPHVKSLNAGVYLAERLFLIEKLEEMLQFMYESPSKGYPYGEMDDQLMWYYIQSQCKNNEVEIDYNSIYFLRIHNAKWTFAQNHWEHFNYFNRVGMLDEK